ncbi:MAG: pantetheine-phosphate adenylyltransferase [Prevotellaceae bacterium]|jgi:pantetheine-phosphate adenylyltransferase|nr:pantetheine-phosphate adenylyltransferase [Prevotellaceae bacterium]
MSIAAFPGSFDPFSVGHYDVVQRALLLFDSVIVAIGVNVEKKAFYTTAERKANIQSLFARNPRVSVQTYEGLTVDFCKKAGATHIVRGVRGAADFALEYAAAQANKAMLPEVDTILLPALPEWAHVSSTIIRDILKNNGNAAHFLPPKYEKFG